MRALNAEGASAWSELGGAQLQAGVPAAPPPPTLQLLSGAAAQGGGGQGGGQGLLLASWAAGDGHGAPVSGHQLQLLQLTTAAAAATEGAGGGGGGGWKTVLSCADDGAGDGGGGGGGGVRRCMQRELMGLTPATSYQLRVASVNAVGVGAWSAPSAPARTLAATPEPVPAPRLSLLQLAPADGESEHAVRIEWEPPPSDGGAEVLGYHVEMMDDGDDDGGGRGGGGGGAWEEVGWGPLTLQRSLEVLDLLPGRCYRARVQARNERGVGRFSERATLRTCWPAPAPPSWGAVRDDLVEEEEEEEGEEEEEEEGGSSASRYCGLVGDVAGLGAGLKPSTTGGGAVLRLSWVPAVRALRRLLASWIDRGQQVLFKAGGGGPFPVAGHITVIVRSRSCCCTWLSMG
eukprot:COSAG01_NODE_4243_length_5211_cov_7.043232_2_plen_403_part_00